VIIMDILHLVDRLEMLVNQGWRLPFTSNVVIQEDAFLDIIDQMRVSIPEEVKQARRVSAERERVLEQAQEEADRIVSLAQEQVSSLADDHEIVKAAYVQAEEVIAQAHRSAQGVKSEADEYVMEVLSGLEEELMRLLTTVRNGIRQVQEVNTPPEAEQQVVKADVDSKQ
jgi:cell division septum initiation protein DivIVA